MQFMLKGFTQDSVCRVFEFDCIGPSQPRTQFTVCADLNLARRHGIRVQELPLLCRSVLESREAPDEARAFIFTEQKMIAYVKECTVAKELAAQKKKSPGKTMDEKIVAGWRPQAL
jgi:hypothetical protein